MSTNGRWITIGGVEGPDGKRHGGSPVYVEGGRITKGAPSLSGRNLAALSEAPPATSRRAENKAAKEYEVARVVKEARQENIDPASLHALAGQIYKAATDHAALVNHMLRRVRSLAKQDPARFGSLSHLAHAFRGGDLTQIRGFDLLASQMRDEYPELFLGLNEGQESGPARENDPYASNADERLYDLILAGNVESASEEKSYELALDLLREHQAEQPAERQPGEDDEDEFPTWQMGLFGGATSRATQTKMFDESPLPKEERDRPDLPGQQMLPGTETVPFHQADVPDRYAAAERGNPMQARRRYQEAPPAEGTMTEEDMRRLLAYQQEHGVGPEEAREQLGYSRKAVPCRMARSQPQAAPQRPRQYSAAEIKAKYLDRRGVIDSREAMERCLRYQAETGCDPEEARRVVLGGGQPDVEKYDFGSPAGFPSGSNTFVAGATKREREAQPPAWEEQRLPLDPHYRGGDAAAADAWGRDQDEAHRRRRQEEKAERNRMAELSNRYGVPISLVGVAMEMAERREALSIEQAIENLIEREKNRQLFGGQNPLSLSMRW